MKVNVGDMVRVKSSQPVSMRAGAQAGSWVVLDVQGARVKVQRPEGGAPAYYGAFDLLPVR